jgi:Ca2+-binding RTX toxin-like protein
MGFGIAIVALLGVGLVFSLGGDDPDTAEDQMDPADAATVENGTTESEFFDLKGGNDTVYAGAGQDVIDAGAGDDRAFGGDDDDLISGAADDDFLRGGAGDDLLYGGAGNDVLHGDVGDDLLVGADIIDGEGMIDAVRVAQAENRDLTDEESASLIDLEGDPGEADTLNGGVGADVIIAGSNDVVDTGSGSDIVNVGDWVDPAEPVEIVDFTASRDVMVYSYIGATEPDVAFGEDVNGTATLVVDGEIVAYFRNADFFDLTAQSAILLEQIG